MQFFPSWCSVERTTACCSAFSLLKSQQACIVLDKLVLLSENRIPSNAALWAEVKLSLAVWSRILT